MAETPDLTAAEAAFRQAEEALHAGQSLPTPKPLTPEERQRLIDEEMGENSDW